MRIKKLFLRMLLAAALGVCAGIIMEYDTAGLIFPTFLITGVLAGIFIEIVIEIIRGALTIAREDLSKLKKPVLKILVATFIGLLAGIILEFAAIWAAFPLFFLLGIFLGTAFGITVEVIRYHRSMRKAFLEGKDFGLERLPLTTAELIRQVIKKMRYRKEVRSEVMAELVAHFEDRLQDCKTNDEKQQRARQLIDDFGDATLLAVLLRRAKKRCRPLWRTVIARTFQAVGALILCFIVYAVWFSTGKPTISVDYLALLNQMNQPEVRNEDNAWPHYEKAIELYVEPDQKIRELTERQRKDFEKKLSFGDLDKDKQDMIRKWLKENESNWDNLELSQKQLFEKCFNEGLVPYVYPVYSSKYSFKRYRIFDKAVEDIMDKIESYQGSGRPDRFSKDYEYGTMMEMEIMSSYGHYPGNQRDIELDPDIALDSGVISLFGEFSQEEFSKVKIGIEAGVIKKWIDSPSMVEKSLFGYLLPFEKKLIVKWIEDNEPAWREFVTGSSKSYCYREYQYRGEEQERFLWYVGSSHFNSIKQLTRVGIWRTRIAAENGQIKQSIDDSLAISRAGRHWQGKGIIVEQLVGLAIGRIVYDEILHILAVQRCSVDQLKLLQNQLSQLYPQGYPLINMEGERVAFMDAIQSLFTKGGPGGGHLIPDKTEMFGNIYHNIVEIADDIPLGKKIFENAALTSMCLLHARRDATVAAGKQIYELAEMIAKMSPAERRERDVGSTDDFISSMPRYRYTLLEYLIPASERISELLYQSKALHQATITILAIQRWNLDKGEYPATLDELIKAGYLKELPVDPYSDKSLIYKKTENNFVLYSLGRNFKDDGGKVIQTDGNPLEWGSYEHGDAVFWPVLRTWELK
jgi:hypothetical protein